MLYSNIRKDKMNELFEDCYEYIETVPDKYGFTVDSTKESVISWLEELDEDALDKLIVEVYEAVI